MGALKVLNGRLGLDLIGEFGVFCHTEVGRALGEAREGDESTLKVFDAVGQHNFRQWRQRGRIDGGHEERGGL